MPAARRRSVRTAARGRRWRGLQAVDDGDAVDLPDDLRDGAVRIGVLVVERAQRTHDALQIVLDAVVPLHQRVAMPPVPAGGRAPVDAGR